MQPDPLIAHLTQLRSLRAVPFTGIQMPLLRSLRVGKDTQFPTLLHPPPYLFISILLFSPSPLFSPTLSPPLLLPTLYSFLPSSFSSSPLAPLSANHCPPQILRL